MSEATPPPAGASGDPDHLIFPDRPETTNGVHDFELEAVLTDIERGIPGKRQQLRDRALAYGETPRDYSDDEVAFLVAEDRVARSRHGFAEAVADSADGSWSDKSDFSRRRQRYETDSKASGIIAAQLIRKGLTDQLGEDHPQYGKEEIDRQVRLQGVLGTLGMTPDFDPKADLFRGLPGRAEQLSELEKLSKAIENARLVKAGYAEYDRMGMDVDEQGIRTIHIFQGRGLNKAWKQAAQFWHELSTPYKIAASVALGVGAVTISSLLAPGAAVAGAAAGAFNIGKAGITMGLRHRGRALAAKQQAAKTGHKLTKKYDIGSGEIADATLLTEAFGKAASKERHHRQLSLGIGALALGASGFDLATGIHASEAIHHMAGKVFDKLFSGGGHHTTTTHHNGSGGKHSSHTPKPKPTHKPSPTPTRSGNPGNSTPPPSGKHPSHPAPRHHGGKHPGSNPTHGQAPGHVEQLKPAHTVAQSYENLPGTNGFQHMLDDAARAHAAHDLRVIHPDSHNPDNFFYEVKVRDAHGHIHWSDSVKDVDKVLAQHSQGHRIVGTVTEHANSATLQSGQVQAITKNLLAHKPQGIDPTAYTHTFQNMLRNGTVRVESVPSHPSEYTYAVRADGGQWRTISIDTLAKIVHDEEALRSIAPTRPNS